VAEVADRVAIMYAGRIVEEGTAEAVFNDPQHPYTIGLMGSLPSLGRREARLAAIPGAVPPPDVWPESCRFASRCPFAASACRETRPALAAVPGSAAHRVACLRAPLEALGAAA
jgi:peptide/nickel transport system ATP-binding protein